MKNVEAMRCAELMSPDPTALRATDSLAKAADEMRLGEIHHPPIVDRNNELVGLLSHRDLVGAGADLTRSIATLMRRDVTTVGPDTPAHEAAYLLLRHNIGCVPVTSPDDQLIGIITEADFVRVAYAVLGGRVPVDQLELEEKEADQV